MPIEANPEYYHVVIMTTDKKLADAIKHHMIETLLGDHRVVDIQVQKVTLVESPDAQERRILGTDPYP